MAQLLLKLVCVLAAGSREPKGRARAPRAGAQQQQARAATTALRAAQTRRSLAGCTCHQLPATTRNTHLNISMKSAPINCRCHQLPAVQPHPPEHVDEVSTNRLSLGLGVGQALEPAQHALCSSRRSGRGGLGGYGVRSGRDTAGGQRRARLPAHAAARLHQPQRLHQRRRCRGGDEETQEQQEQQEQPQQQQQGAHLCRLPW